MIKERLGGHGKEDILQLFQVLHTGYLFARLRVAEDEVAEAEVVHHGTAQVHVHLLGVLVDEGRAVFGGIGGILRFAALDDQRHEGVFLADGRAELDAAQSILRAAFCLGEADVGDDAQQVVLILLINAVGLVVRACQDNLGTASHAQGALVGIQGFGAELLALLQHELV